MIRSFKGKITEAVFNDEIPKGFQEDIARVARRKLGYLHAAAKLDDLRAPPGNRLEALKEIGRDSTRSGSTISSASALCGPRKVRKTWRSLIIISA
jgi:hypothetical protein